MSRKRPQAEALVPGDDTPWGEKETEMLKRALLGHRGSEEDVDWENICAIVFHGRGHVVKRDPTSCRARAVQLGLLGKGVRVEKIPWKEEEKEALAWAVAGFEGPATSIPWALIADTLFHGRGGLTRRDGKGCREQWNRSINPDLDHKPLGEEEQRFVYELATKIGNKWTRISQLLGSQFRKAPPGAERVKKGFEKYKRKLDKLEGGESAGPSVLHSPTRLQLTPSSCSPTNLHLPTSSSSHSVFTPSAIPTPGDHDQQIHEAMGSIGFPSYLSSLANTYGVGSPKQEQQRPQTDFSLSSLVSGDAGEGPGGGHQGGVGGGGREGQGDVSVPLRVTTLSRGFGSISHDPVETMIPPEAQPMMPRGFASVITGGHEPTMASMAEAIASALGSPVPQQGGP